MKLKTILLISMAAVVLTSCGGKLEKNLKGDWWPIHASGSYETQFFTAQWDGDLDDHGGISVVYKSKDQGGATYTDTRYYPAVSFTTDARKKDKVRFISLRYEITRSDYLDYRLEDGKIYFEKQDSDGKGTGEFMEAQDIRFVNDHTLKIGNVTYESYAHYKERHRGLTFQLLPGRGWSDCLRRTFPE